MSDHFNQHDSERKTTRRNRGADMSDAGAVPAPSHPLLQLQRTIGNAQVARMLQRQPEEEEQMQAKRDPALQRQAEEEELQAKREPALQRQPEEEEQLQAKRDPALQRHHDEEQVQAKRDDAPEVGLEGGPISTATQGRIQSMRGGGSPLGGDVQSRMEGAFNADLSDVRLHTGAESASVNRSVGAKAFTTGSDIFFGQGASPSDTGLLAHELTHVVQQRSMASSGGSMTVTAAGDQNEQAADAAAAAITTSPPAQRKEETDK